MATLRLSSAAGLVLRVRFSAGGPPGGPEHDALEPELTTILHDNDALDIGKQCSKCCFSETPWQQLTLARRALLLGRPPYLRLSISSCCCSTCVGDRARVETICRTGKVLSTKATKTSVLGIASCHMQCADALLQICSAS